MRTGLRLLEREEAELRDLRIRLTRGILEPRDGTALGPDPTVQAALRDIAAWTVETFGLCPG